MQTKPKTAKESAAGRESEAPQSSARIKRGERRPGGKLEVPPIPDEEQFEVADEFDGGQLPPTPRRTSGTLPDLVDSGQLSVNDPGLSVDPEQLAMQFLRDATEQDNFESEVAEVEALEPGDAALGQLISEGTLNAAGQSGLDIPESEALHTRLASGSTEGEQDEGDSLGELSIDEAAMDDVGQHTPAGADEAAYNAEVERLREQLRHTRDGGAKR